MIVEKMKDPNRRTGNDVEDDIEAAIQREAEAMAEEAVDPETGEILKSPEAEKAQAEVESLKGEMCDIIAGSVRFIRRLDAEIVALKAHIDDSKKILERLKRTQEKAEARAIYRMTRNQYKTITDGKTGLCVTLCKPRESVITVDSKIPAEFMRIKSITGLKKLPSEDVLKALGDGAKINLEPNKTAIAKAIHAGEAVPGARIELKASLRFSK